MNDLIEKVNWSRAEKVFEIITKALFLVLTMLVGVIAYQGQQVLQNIHDHEVRLTRIESSRYTTEDARRDATEQRNDMREFIALHLKPINDSLVEIKQAVKENRDARLKG